MASQSLELLIKVRNETDAAIKALQTGLQKTGQEAKQTAEKLAEAGRATSSTTSMFGSMQAKLIGLAAGFVSVRAVVDLVTSSLKAQAEQEASINKLNLALANQGHFTEATSKSLQAYADSMQATTTFSDDAVLSAQAVLASFGMNEEQIKRTTKAAADFAAATKTDLTTASELLGKAFVGNTATLSRYGVVIDESIPKAQRFEAAMAQLNQRFAGSAQADTATFTGGMAQLKNAFGEVQEGLGKLIGSLFDSQGAFAAAIGWANQFANFLKVDMVLAVSEARAQILEFQATLVSGRTGGFLEGLVHVIKGDATNAMKAFRGETDHVGESLKNTYLKAAAAAREHGNQVAATAGHLLKVTNATNVHTRAVDAHAVAQKKLADVLGHNAFQMRELGEKLTNDLEKQLDERFKTAQDFVRKQVELDVEEAEARARAGQEAIEAGRRRMEEEVQAQKDALAEISEALFKAGEEAGGFLGALLQLGSGGVAVFLSLQHHAEITANRTMSTAEKLAAAANALNAAVGAFSGGSVVGGAVGGAAAGAAFGPLGAGIGAAVGGLLGLFGGARKAREELEKLRTSVVQGFGSMQAFAAAANRVGIDVSRAFSTRDPKEFKAIVDSVNHALADQKARLEGLKTAMGGLELMTKGFAAQMERSGAATETSQAAFNRLGTFAMATFAGIVRETGDVIGALQQMGGSLDALVQAQHDFGFASSAALDRLLGLRNVITANEDVAQSIQGLNQLMTGLGEAGLVTRDLFVAFGQDAAAQFAELQARGVDSNAAMALMQPTLQTLWEQQKRFGNVTDEATAALLRQAEEQGLVGDQMRSVNEQILEVLLAIGEVLGAAIPNALRHMGDTADEQLGRMRDAADATSSSLRGIAVGHDRFEESATVPNFAGGGTIHAPASGTLARLHNTEHVTSTPQLQEIVGIAVQAALRAIGGGAGGTQAGGVVILNMDGQKVGEGLMRRNRAGLFTIDKFSVK